MAIYYVSSTADGTRNGTQPTNGVAPAGPWTLAQAVAAAPAAGDDIRIMADGTYGVGATQTLAYANGSGAANILFRGANSSGTVDGTRATIQATAASVTCLNVTGSCIEVRYLIFDGNAQTTSVGCYINTNYSRVRQCKAMNCTSYGIRVGDSLNVAAAIRCEATNCSGTAAIYIGGPSKAKFCEAYANKTHGFQVGNGSALINCYSYINTTTGAVGGGGSIDGFNNISVGYVAHQCVAYKNGRAGFDLTANAGLGTYLSNCIAEQNGGEGYATDGVKSAAYLLNCGGYLNTSGNYNTSNLLAANVEGFVANTTGTFFNGGDTGDFSLNNITGQGKLARAAGFPGLMPRGVTTGYLDIGGAQHQDPAGGAAASTPIIVGA